MTSTVTSGAASTDLVGQRVVVVGRDDGVLRVRGIVRAVTYVGSTFHLLIEAVEDAVCEWWSTLKKGHLFDVSLSDEVNAVVVDREAGE